MSHKGLHKLLLIFGFLFPWISPLSAQNNRLMLLNEEWDSYSQTSNRHVNGWDFCKSGINDQSIVQRSNLHAFLSTGSSAGSGTTIATPWLDQIADTFSFYIYGSTLNGHTAQVEFGFIPDNATISDPSDICTYFIPYDTVNLSVSNQWQRTTRDMRPYYAIHGTTHRLAIRLINSYSQKIYLDEIRAWIPKGNTSTCPNITSAGRDFWATFLYNYHETYNYLNPGELRLTALSTQDCELDIYDNVNGHYTTQLNASNNHYTRRVVGTNASLPVATVYDGGYHITSTEDIWLYATNYVQETQDVATVIPTSVLDTHYIVQDYPAWQFGAQVAFVATEDNTVLTMTVPCNIQGTTITAGTTLTPTLMRGQSYLLISNGNNSSFSGMEVTSNGKPFAMFQGGRRVKVPTNGSNSDLLFEQALPPSQWGNEFIVAGVTGQSGKCYIRITSAEDNCSVSINGAAVTSLNARQTYETTITSTTGKHIVTSKPCCVILYLASNTQAGYEGDPSTITIPPVNKGVCSSRFQTHNSPKVENNRHKVTIICDTAWSDYMLLDGDPLPSANSLIDGYKMYQITLPYSSANNGIHHVENSHGPFIAYAYGLGYEWESYAFPLGFSFNPVIVRIHRDTVAFNDSICQGHAYNSNGFSIGANETQVATTLSRMDSTMVDDTTIHYHSLMLTVLPSSNVEVNKTLSPNGSLNFAGTTITDTGTYVFYLTATNGCDSTVTLHVHAHDGTCPNNTSAGRDFWITFVPNGLNTTPSFSVIATGLSDATITVANPQTGWSTTASHSAGGKTVISLPSVNLANTPSATPSTLGFHVTSTANISLVASNYIIDGWDFCNVIPTQHLSSQYIVQDYPNSSSTPGGLCLVATEDNTILSMVLPCTVENLSLPAGSTYSVTLNTGQTLALKCGTNNGFSGMTVTSNNKPFALFQGHPCAFVGTSDNLRGRDHLMEQALPIECWGREFVVLAEQDRTEGDQVRITAATDSTQVSITSILGTRLCLQIPH